MLGRGAGRVVDEPSGPLEEAQAWGLLRALAAAASEGHPVVEGEAVALGPGGELLRSTGQDGPVWICDAAGDWGARPVVDDQARMLFDLYMPLCVGQGAPTLVAAHLGQSLDGRVSTVTGASQFITGPEDVRHTHRLRALFDAVVVGVQTANIDDPRLTTRLVPGEQPVRVVLDPRGRLGHGCKLLTDGRARTIVFTGPGLAGKHPQLPRGVEVVEAELRDDAFILQGVLDGLAARGLSRVFVEGGGVTVSRFLDARLLDRLHITVAPKIIGSGVPALNLSPIETLADVLHTPARHFALGADQLFDCSLESRRR